MQVRSRVVRSGYQRVNSFFNKGSKRSAKAKKNAAISLIIKVVDRFSGLLLVPILLGYLGQMQYGIWLTVASILTWFNFMDVGLGNGLRNKFAEAITKNEHELAKKYVSTTFAIVALIIGTFLLVFTAVNRFIPWVAVFNAPADLKDSLATLGAIVVVFYGLNFFFRLFIMILMADQRPAVGDAISLIGRFFIIAGIFLITKLHIDRSLIYVGVIYSVIPVVVLAIATIYSFSTRYRRYAPSFKSIDFSLSKDLFGLGIKFFVMQISTVVLYTTDSIIIAQLFGPDQVTPYQVAGKYFQIVLVPFSAIMSPMWSAYTEAYHKNDFNWIRRVIRKQEKLWFGVAAVIIGMVLLSGLVYRFWLRQDLEIPIFLTITWAFFVLLQTYNKIHTSFLNGINKVKLQMITTVFTIVMNIPLSIYFARPLGMGISGVILATCVSLLIYCVTRKIQVDKILNGTAKGIWDK